MSSIIRFLAATLLTGSVALASTERKEPLPKELEEVGVTERLDVAIPSDLTFFDSDGNEVTLDDVFDGDKPVILTLNYSDCPMLCSLQLNGLVEAMKNMNWTLGKEYEVLTISIDPLEQPERAKRTKKKYIDAYGRPGTGDGWHFFTTPNEENIKRVASTVGYGYSFDPVTREYAHAAVLMLCTPDGRVSRYLYGVEYNPQTLKFSMMEAGEGKIGSTMDQILLFCFHYDSSRGRYGPHAMRMMQLGGGLTVLLLGGMISVYWIRERRKGRVEEEGTS